MTFLKRLAWLFREDYENNSKDFRENLCNSITQCVCDCESECPFGTFENLGQLIKELENIKGE